MQLLSSLIKGATVDNEPVRLELRPQPVLCESDDQPADSEIDSEEVARQIVEQAERRAEQIISQAQADAAKLLEEARAQSEELKKIAEQQGYQQGIALAEDEAEEIRRQARDVLAQAEQARKQTLDAMQQEIIDLAVEIAEKILTTQLTVDAEIVLQIAHETIRLVRDREHITMYVNPAELQIYIDHQSELKEALSAQAELAIIADERIKPGGCLVDTDQGMVDATVDARWQEVLQAVLAENNEAS